MVSKLSVLIKLKATTRVSRKREQRPERLHRVGEQAAGGTRRREAKRGQRTSSHKKAARTNPRPRGRETHVAQEPRGHHKQQRRCK